MITLLPISRRLTLYTITLAFSLLILSTTFYRRADLPSVQDIHHSISDNIQEIHDNISPPPPPPGPKYKPKSLVKAPTIIDNFPLLANGGGKESLPPLPKWIKKRERREGERTPLFIGFTRNWRLLQQVVVGYITTGWPAEDIYVVENTGVMDANKLGQLSLQNPFFLNHTRLDILGVNVLITPTLFTFAQLQNFYLWTSTVEKYPYYFWSHMDVVAVTYEMNYKKEHPDVDLTDPKNTYDDFRSIYDYCLEALREVLVAKDEKTGNPLKWAMRFFSYDRLALVNVEAFRHVGGWDTMIPFYMTDCDMHSRLEMEGFHIQEKPAGMIYDVGSSLDDLVVLYRKKSGPPGYDLPKASFIDPHVQAEELEAMAASEKALADAGFTGKDEQSAKPSTTPAATTNPRSLTPRGSGWEDDTLDSELYFHLWKDTLERMQGSKNSGDRNHWQAQQTGGQGDPFYRDSAGFEKAIQITIEHGRHIYREKWGHRDCDIITKGLRPEDAWLVEHDWD